jgi:hypothetical protein
MVISRHGSLENLKQNNTHGVVVDGQETLGRGALIYDLRSESTVNEKYHAVEQHRPTNLRSWRREQLDKQVCR